MRDYIHQKRLALSRQTRLLAAATLSIGVLVAGCGGSSGSSTGSPAGGATTSASHTASSGSTTPDVAGSAPGLAFARCMRANGVPNFPDPSAGRGLVFNAAGINPAAPAVKAAQAKCFKLLPVGPTSFGSRTHPSPQTLEKLLKIARCMRQHGVPQFPDPQTYVPSNPAASGITEITDFDNAILLFPASINMEAPAYRQALAACGAPPLGLPH